MKRLVCFVLTIISSLFILGCTSSDDNKINIVTVSFSDYEFCKQVTQNLDNYNVHYLLKNGEDAHSFQATFQDKMLLSKANLVVYSGGESTSWIDTLIPTNCKVVKYSEFLTPICLDGDHHDEEHNHLIDEHYSLSIKNAIKIVKKIETSLSEIDQDKSSIFEENANLYIQNLQELDLEYEILKTSETSTVIVCDRQPFSYLFNDYDITCFSAIKGCSSEIDCSISTIVELSNKLNENSLNSVLVTESAKLDIANSVINNCGKDGVQILTLNSMQSIKLSDNKNYIDICRENLQVLKICLGVKNG